MKAKGAIGMLIVGLTVFVVSHAPVDAGNSDQVSGTGTVLESGKSVGSNPRIKVPPGSVPVGPGPAIMSFTAVAGDCVSPDPTRAVVAYRVVAQGSARIQRVVINALHRDGDRVRTIYEQNAPQWSPWSKYSETGIRDPQPSADVYAYVLAVYDTHGQAISKRLNFKYSRPVSFQVLRNARVDYYNTGEFSVEAHLVNAGSGRWDCADSTGTRRSGPVAVRPSGSGGDTHTLLWGPYPGFHKGGKSLTCSIAFEPVTRACGEQPVRRVILVQ
jgi:hypothetical protein